VVSLLGEESGSREEPSLTGMWPESLDSKGVTQKSFTYSPTRSRLHAALLFTHLLRLCLLSRQLVPTRQRADDWGLREKQN
jgi:hypothetical protein